MKGLVGSPDKIGSEPWKPATGVSVIDLFAPFPIGGALAVADDPGSGVNVVAMEVMQNLNRKPGS
jgi:F0F1-type ATP synthase beta subunit